MKILLGGIQGRKAKEIRIDPALAFTCPVCDAKKGERCHVQPGVIRFEPHEERIDRSDKATVRLYAESKMLSTIARPQFPQGWDAA